MSTFISDLDTGSGSQKLWQDKNGDYVVSSAIPFAFDHGGPETMVFRAGEDGNVVSWADLAVVYAVDHEAAIAQYDSTL